MRKHLQTGRLVALLADYTLPGPSLYAVYPRRAGAARIRSLVRFIEDAVKHDLA